MEEEFSITLSLTKDEAEQLREYCLDVVKNRQQTIDDCLIRGWNKSSFGESVGAIHRQQGRWSLIAFSLAGFLNEHWEES